MRVFVASVLFGTVLLVAPLPAAAEHPHPETFVETSRQTMLVFASCAEEGELLLVESTYHSVSHVTAGDDRFIRHSTTFTHMSGTSLTTGARYVGSEGPFIQHGKFEWAAGSGSETFVATWVMNRVGRPDLPADDFRLHVTLRQTVDTTTGESTTTVDNQRVECT